MPESSTVINTQGVYAPPPTRVVTVGARFRHARRSFGLSVDEIAEDIKIRADLLRAIEGGAFDQIAEPLYRTFMVKTYAEYLGIDWNVIHDEYRRESVYVSEPEQGTRVSRTSVQRTDLVVAPRLLKHVLLSAATIGVCFYLAILAAGALQRPSLIIVNPPDNFLSSAKTIRIEGVASRDATLMINGQEVIKTENGHFYQDVTLSEGVNSIRVSAAKKYSKEMSVMRTVLYEAPSLPLTLNDDTYGKRSN